MSWKDDPIVSSDIPSVARVESGGDPNAVSPKGARGVMQVMPGTNTAPGFGVVPARDQSEAERTRVGEDYLSALQQKYGREDGLMAYNWGPGNFDKWVAGGRNPSKVPKETQAYVPKVTGGKVTASWKDDPLADEPAADVPRVEATGLAEDQPPKRGVLSRTLEGIKTGAKVMRDEMFPPGNPINSLSMGTVGTDDTIERQAEVQRAKDELPSLGTAGAVGSKIPEVALSLVPTARAGNVLSKVPALVKTLGRFAPMAADVGVNAAYEGGKSALTGSDNVLGDAASGGIGAGIGHGIGSLLQRGVSPLLGKRARELIDNDITPTYGQALGRNASAVENAAGYAPIIGSAIDRARNVTLRQYSRAEVNKAMAPLGFKTKAVGEDAVREGQDAVSRSYNAVVDQTHMPAIDAQNAILKAQQDFGTMPLLTEPQIKQLNKYIDDKIQPELSFSQQTNNIMPGRTAKNIDAELGAYARKYSESSNPADHELGDAFRKLQAHLRDALDSNDPAALASLKKSNAAFRNMLPVGKSSSKAAGDIGEFNPVQHFRSLEQFGQPTDSALNRAGRELLPTTSNMFRSGSQVAGPIALAAASPLTAAGVAGLAAGAHAAYSLPVRSAILRGVLPNTDKLGVTAGQVGGRVGASNAADKRRLKRALAQQEKENAS